MKKQRILLVGIISVGVIALLILFGWLFRKPLYRLSLGDIDARYRSAMLAYQEHRYADARKELAPLARLDTAKCAQFLLGDLLYHGPRNPLPEGYEPPAVAKLLNDMADELLCVRGNCDAEVDQMVLHFPILSDSALLVLDGLTIHATHGHIHGPDTPPPLRQGDILLCGHFHVPVRRDCGRYTYLNPGSAALPKENSPHSCMVLEGGQFTWLDVVTGQPFQPRG